MVSSHKVNKKRKRLISRRAVINRKFCKKSYTYVHVISLMYDEYLNLNYLLQRYCPLLSTYDTPQKKRAPLPSRVAMLFVQIRSFSRFYNRAFANIKILSLKATIFLTGLPELLLATQTFPIWIIIFNAASAKNYITFKKFLFCQFVWLTVKNGNNLASTLGAFAWIAFNLYYSSPFHNKYCFMQRNKQELSIFDSSH